MAPAPGSPAVAAPGGPGITLKAVLFGLIGVAIISLYSNTNDRVLKLSPLVGNHMPIGAFTLILLLATVWNPLIGRLWSRLRFGTRELAVVLGMMLICSWLPGSSFYRYFHYSVIMPWTNEASHPEWQANKTLSFLPDQVYPLRHDPGTDPTKHAPGTAETLAVRKAYERVYGSFTRGIPEGDESLKLSQAPLREWLPTMVYWTPLALLMATALIAMIFLVHRQWAHHEQLSYPMASVSTALIERTGSRLTSDLFYSRLFWAGFAPVFAIHLINYLQAWFPNYLPRIPLQWGAWDIVGVFPVLNNVGAWVVCDQRITFMIIGFSYFIASEISLSMSLSTIAVTIVGAQFFLATGTTVSDDDKSCVLAGAYGAYFLILLYTGRHYYLNVLAKALGLRGSTSVDRQPIWAARIFLGAFAGLVSMLVLVFDMDWFIALIFAMSLMIYFLVFARIVAETGIPFLQANFDIGYMLSLTLGVPALGPTSWVMVMYMGLVLNPDARECVTPYVANTLKISENVGIRLPRIIMVGALATLVAFAIGFVSQTYSVYNKGAHNDDYALHLPENKLSIATAGLAVLHETGQFASSESTHGLAKLGQLANNVGHGPKLGWIGFGILGTIMMSVMRFRFGWWPLHPVIFLMWGTWTSSLVWFSFFLGWVTKELIVRFGGGKTYQSLKPLFIGLIMGEIIAVAMILLVGFCYYMNTGLIPKNTGIFPG